MMSWASQKLNFFNSPATLFPRTRSTNSNVPFWRARLDLIQVTPTRPGDLLLQVVAKTRKGMWDIGILFATGLVWFAFIAQVYVSEFLHLRPVTAWLNQPLIRLPWFRYVPAQVKNPLPEIFLTVLFLAVVFGLRMLVNKLRRLGDPKGQARRHAV